MPEHPITHDQFFRTNFGRPEMVAAFVRSYLPADVAAALDLSRIERDERSFIDKRFREHQSDVLVQVGLVSEGDCSDLASGDSKIPKDAWLYLLFEHKSRNDDLAALQLLRYCVNIWQRDVLEARKSGHSRPSSRSRPSPLQPIIPILIYHGDRPWRVSTDFGDLFVGPEALKRYWPRFRYALLDLYRRPADEIQGWAYLRVVLLTMKFVFSPDLAARLPRIMALLRNEPSSHAFATFVYMVLVYAGRNNEFLSEELILRSQAAAHEEFGGAEMPNVVDQLLERGRQEGRQKGRQEGRQEGQRSGLLTSIELTLRMRFGDSSIHLLEQIHNIEEPEVLEQVLGVLLKTERLEEIEEGLLRESYSD